MASFYTPPTLSEMEEEGLLLLGSQSRRKFQKSGWATTKIQTKSPFESRTRFCFRYSCQNMKGHLPLRPLPVPRARLCCMDVLAFCCGNSTYRPPSGIASRRFVCCYLEKSLAAALWSNFSIFGPKIMRPLCLLMENIGRGMAALSTSAVGPIWLGHRLE